MIVEYHRPNDLSEALKLLKRSQPLTLPLGGGTLVSRRGQSPDVAIAVVDVQRLSLNKIQREGDLLTLGAAVTLQQLVECAEIPPALKASLELEAGLNLRQMHSLAGIIVACDGRSPFVTALLALDAHLEWAGEKGQESLGNYLALKPEDPFEDASNGRLMTSVRLMLNAQLAFESVGRAPLDQPVVCAAVAKWPAGRTRLALGGYGKAPILAMDGPEPAGAGMAARSAYLQAGDAWASAEYRAEIAATLAARLAAGVEG